jgi:rod shape-determining protein MreD
MKVLVYLGMAIAVLWLQLTLPPLGSVYGVKPNLMLLTVLVIGLRWQEPFQFVYAALAGMTQDVFSHGILGIYGLSFFAIYFLARLAGSSFYENNLLFGSLAVLGLSVVEGAISLTLLNFLDSDIPWFYWMFTSVLPAALYNSLVSPLVFLAMGRMEGWVRVSES